MIDVIKNIQIFQESSNFEQVVREQDQDEEILNLKEEQKREVKNLEEEFVKKRERKPELIEQIQLLHTKKESQKTFSAPECPVCFELMIPPIKIFNCPNGHLLCEMCKPNIQLCTLCRNPYVGRATAMEQIIKEMMENKKA